MEVDFATTGHAAAHPIAAGHFSRRPAWHSRALRQFSQVNNELWLLLSIFVVAILLNTALDAHRMLLGLYTLPTLFSA